MNTTHCNKCIFSKPASEHPACEFGIPEAIAESNKDKLSIIDNYYAIDNYHCLYGFSKHQYESNTDAVKNLDIKNILIEKANLKYYLLIDARQVKDKEFTSLINTINTLDIKPTKLSILINPNRSEELYQLINTQLCCPKWTVHVFINTLSFNDCANIVLDTNLPNCGAWCVIFYDGTKITTNSNININLENITNYLHKKIIIQQSTSMGFINSPSDLHGLCLNCSLYKYLTSVIANDILKAIKINQDLVLQNYENT